MGSENLRGSEEDEEIHFGKSLCVKILFLNYSSVWWRKSLGFGFGCHLLFV